MTKSKTILVQNVPVTLIQQSDTDFISLTDMVRESENGSAVIDNWLRNKNTLEFLSVWEEIYNPAFNSLEFEEIKKVAGLNRFTMSAKQWINFATGHQHNLDEVQGLVTPAQWANFSFILGDIRNLDDCHKAAQGVDYILHQAALGSVPRSVADPISTNATNITGFLNMLVAARDANDGLGVKRFVYAASSSTYGDHPGLPKVEDTIGKPLSPYAVTKYVNELYADVFGKT